MKEKAVVVIIIYRIPNSSDQGVYKAITQYNKMREQEATATKYHKEVFQEIIDYCEKIEELNDIILAGDLNQDIASREVQHFFNKLGMKDIYQ